MHVLKLPASAGISWLVEGFSLFRKSPPHFLLFTGLYCLVMFMAMVLPVIGQLIGNLLIPILALGIMRICREIEQKKPIYPQLLFAGFKENLRGLIKLALISLVISNLIFMAVGLIDGREAFARAGEEANTLRLVGFSELSITEIVASSVFLFTFMAWWFAPILVAWHRFPINKALFFSLMACVRNWQAFVACFVTIIVASIVIAFLLTTLLPATLAATILISLALFVGIPLNYACAYCSYRSIFAGIDAYA